jgi:hypothetical protein
LGRWPVAMRNSLSSDSNSLSRTVATGDSSAKFRSLNGHCHSPLSGFFGSALIEASRSICSAASLS